MGKVTFIYLYAFLQGCNPTLFSTTHKNRFSIRGNVEQVNQYCEGARPTKEILGTAYQAKPYPNKTFYIINGYSNFTSNSEIIKTFSTDLNGDFTFKLPPGRYSAILDEQFSPLDLEGYQNENYSIDKDCIDEWMEKPFYTFEITDHDLESLKFSFINRCFLKTHVPCITFIGAMKH